MSAVQLLHYQPYRDRWVQVRRRGIESLSDRELCVAKMVACGKTVAEISDALGICTKTGWDHRRNAMQKLGVSDSVTLAHLLLNRGLIRNLYADEPNG